jgi:hypothetical protein
VPHDFRQRLQGIADDLVQYIVDVEWFNRHRADAAPFDCEPQRVMLGMARRALAAFDQGKFEDSRRLSAEMADYAVCSRNDPI